MAFKTHQDYLQEQYKTPEILQQGRVEAIGRRVGAEQQRQRPSFEDVTTNILLPLIGAAEVIGSKGRSRGETALAAQQSLLAQQEKRKAEEQARLKAQQEAQKPENVLKRMEAQAGIKHLKNMANAQTDEERLQHTMDFIAATNPAKFAEIENKSVKEAAGSIGLRMVPEKEETPEQFAARMVQMAEMYPDMRITGGPPQQDIADKLAQAMAMQNIKGQERPLPAKQAIDLGATKTGVLLLDRMRGSMGAIEWGGPIFGNIRRFNPWDSSAQGIQQLQVMTKQIIGKGLEGGVLRKEDEYKYEKIIPKQGDTPKALSLKYNNLRNMLIAKYQGDRTSLQNAGFNVSQFGDIPDAPSMPTWEQYDNLPSGTQFTDPNGNIRRKP